MQLTEDGLSQALTHHSLSLGPPGAGEEASVSGCDRKQSPGSAHTALGTRVSLLGEPAIFWAPAGPGPEQLGHAAGWQVQDMFSRRSGHSNMGRAGQGARANQICHVSKGWISHKLHCLSSQRRPEPAACQEWHLIIAVGALVLALH